MPINFSEFFTSTLFQIFLFSLVALVFGALLAVLSLVVQKVFKIGKSRKLKSQVYECGMRPLGESNIQFDVKYYVFALMFIVFDVEFVFLVPWALSLGSLKTMSSKIFILTEAFIFIALLGGGLYYAYKKGALEWE